MEEIVCQICIKDFDEGDAIPTVLKCGHTFCIICIEQVIATSKRCPKCREKLSTENINDYVVNYSLIGILNSLKNGTTLQTFLQRLIGSLKTDFLELGEKFHNCLEDQKLNLTNIQKNYDLIQSHLSRIEDLVNEKDSEDVKSVMDTVQMLKEQLEDIKKNVIKLPYSFRDSHTLNYCEFESCADFLLEIYKRTLDGDQFYAVATVDHRVKYSLISVRDNKLLIHAFDCPVEGHHVKTVNFQEIKQCLSDVNYRAFLEIGCNDRGTRQVILIRTFNSSLIPRFLMLCTGERGPAYKGVTFSQGANYEAQNTLYATSLMNVGFEIIKNGERNEINEYTSNLGTKIKLEANEEIVVGYASGSFKICQIVKSGIPLGNAIGKIEEPHSLLGIITYENDRKIHDSGIAIVVT